MALAYRRALVLSYKARDIYTHHRPNEPWLQKALLTLRCCQLLCAIYMAVVARVWIELSDLYRVHDTRTHIKRLNMYFAASGLFVLPYILGRLVLLLLLLLLSRNQRAYYWHDGLRNWQRALSILVDTALATCFLYLFALQGLDRMMRLECTRMCQRWVFYDVHNLQFGKIDPSPALGAVCGAAKGMVILTLVLGVGFVMCAVVEVYEYTMGKGAAKMAGMEMRGDVEKM